MARASMSERDGPLPGGGDPFGDVAAPPLRRAAGDVLLLHPGDRIGSADDRIARGHRALRLGILLGLLLAGGLVLGAVVLRTHLDGPTAAAPSASADPTH